MTPRIAGGGGGGAVERNGGTEVDGGVPPIRKRPGILFTHEVGQGPCEIKGGYGILMSELCGFPEAMVDEARAIQRTVRNLFPLLIQSQPPDESLRGISATLQALLLLQNSTLDDVSFCRYLAILRRYAMLPCMWFCVCPGYLCLLLRSLFCMGGMLFLYVFDLEMMDASSNVF